tara:strand:- start:326 stop:772 length:447 start_codon:yes stop_codon:yes gene_type:complete
MLTQGHLKSIKPQAKMRRYHDGHGLYLQVMPQGGRYWRMKYHIKVAEKRVEKTLALGVYPDLSLKDARIAAFNAKQQLKNGIDPSLYQRTQRYEQAHARAKLFLGLAEQWFNTKKTNWSDSHRDRQQRLLFTDLKPLHKLPLRSSRQR